jgi:hypothetical protein
MTYYILKDKKPVASTFEEWREQRDGFPSKVAKHETDLVLISTVFLGLGGVMFESAVFDNNFDMVAYKRMDTYEEALTAHKDFVTKYA